MTPKEFKAWFEGFTEAMEGRPTEDQWKKIKARVAQIDGTPTSYPVFVDRYWPRIPGRWVERLEPYTVKCAAGSDGWMLLNSGKGTGPGFNPMMAMRALGHADYEDAA